MGSIFKIEPAERYNEKYSGSSYKLEPAAVIECAREKSIPGVDILLYNYNYA
jgi:hypothetical protein